MKQGLILTPEDRRLPGAVKRMMVPVPYLVNSSLLRIFITFCDARSIGRVGYVDVDPEAPHNVLNVSESPALDIGEPGAFDDNGVVTASVLPLGERLFLYYSGFQLGTQVPYFIFSGLAVSLDGGRSFSRVSRAPLLDRTEAELFFRCAPVVEREGDGFRMWYTGDIRGGWIEKAGKKFPLYGLKTAFSRSHDAWPGQVEEALPLNADTEHGISLPSLWDEEERRKMIYSVRTHSHGYVLGYAESADGVHFTRRDGDVGIARSPSGWDSTMVCFGKVFRHKGRTHVFYCGNDYGATGLGYATLAD